MSSSTLATIQTQFNLYGYSISMIFGNIGNVFIVILFSRQRQNACSIYLISSAIVNIVYLTFIGFVQILPFDYGNRTILAIVLCKLRSYIPSVLGQVAKTMIVLACVDRFMITSDRATLRAFSTPKRAKYLMLFSVVIWSILPCHIPILTTILNGQCGSFGIYSTILTIYILIFVGVIPPIISTVFGYLTYRNMKRLHNRIQPMTHHTNDANASIRRRDRDLLVIVISEIFVYIITSIPYPLILLETMISKYLISNKSIQYAQAEGLVLTIAYLFLFINSAAPFYTYLVSSKSFRRDFTQLMINSYRKIRNQLLTMTVTRMDQTVAQRNTRV